MREIKTNTMFENFFNVACFVSHKYWQLHSLPALIYTKIEKPYAHTKKIFFFQMFWKDGFSKQKIALVTFPASLKKMIFILEKMVFLLKIPAELVYLPKKSLIENFIFFFFLQCYGQQGTTYFKEPFLPVSPLK